MERDCLRQADRRIRVDGGKLALDVRAGRAAPAEPNGVSEALRGRDEMYERWFYPREGAIETLVRFDPGASPSD